MNAVAARPDEGRAEVARHAEAARAARAGLPAAPRGVRGGASSVVSPTGLGLLAVNERRGAGPVVRARPAGRRTPVAPAASVPDGSSPRAVPVEARVEAATAETETATNPEAAVASEAALALTEIDAPVDTEAAAGAPNATARIFGLVADQTRDGAIPEVVSIGARLATEQLLSPKPRPSGVLSRGAAHNEGSPLVAVGAA